MMNGSRVARYAGAALAENSSSSTGSTSNASSSSSRAQNDTSKTKRGTMNDSTTAGNRLAGAGKQGHTASGFPHSSSPPQLPAVPLLTEKQQQLLLRYLCISNDETSRMLMQAATRQNSFSATGRAPAATTAAVGLRSAARGGDDETSGEATVSHSGGGIRKAAAAPKSSIPSTERPAARASCSSPVSPFAVASRNTSKSFTAATSRTRSSASTPLQQERVDCWEAAADELPLQQQQPKTGHQQQSHALVLRPNPQLTDLPDRQQEQLQRMMAREQQQEQEQQQQVQLRTTASVNSFREQQDAAAAVPAVCPLRPCLRRRSNVRFRSPVAVDLSLEEPTQDESIAAGAGEGSAGVPAASSEAQSDCAVVADAVAIDTRERGRASTCCLATCVPPSCCSSCHTVDVWPSGFPHPPHDSRADTRGVTSGPAEETPRCHTQILRCCCCCSASATCGTISHVSGPQCCCSHILCEDGRAAAPAQAVSQGRSLLPAAGPAPSVQASQPPPATAAAVTALFRRHCDASAALDHCNFCRRDAYSSPRGVFHCCCLTCYNHPLRVDGTSSTSFKDTYEDSSFHCASASLRRRTVGSAVSAATADAAEEATGCTQGLSEADVAAATAARGAAGQERAHGGATERANAAASTQQFCRHLPSHEEEGPRPCCGPGTCEKITLQRAYEGEQEEDGQVCCSSCCSEHTFTAKSIPPVSTPAAGNQMKQDKVHSCFNASTHPPAARCPLRDDAKSALEPAGTAWTATTAQEKQATAAPAEGGTAFQFGYQCPHLCCDQREQRHQHKLPVCCCRQAVRTHEMGKEQKHCLYLQRSHPAVGTAFCKPIISCPASSSLCGAKSASPSLLLNAGQQHLQTERNGVHGQPWQAPVQQEQTHAQHQRWEQVQEQLNVENTFDSHTDLHQLPKEEQQQIYTYHAGTSNRQAHLSRETQSQRQMHQRPAARNRDPSSELPQPGGIYLRPPTTAHTVAPVSGRPVGTEAHTPSTAATVSSVTPPATPAHAAAPPRAGKEAVPLKPRETDFLSRRRQGSTRPPTGRASAARPLIAGTTATTTAATPAVAAVQTAATREDVVPAWRTAGRGIGATSVAARGLSVEGMERALLPEGTPWKAGPSDSNRQPSGSGARPLGESTSAALLQSNKVSQGLPADCAGVEPRTGVGGRCVFQTVGEAASRPLSGVNKNGFAGGYPAERVLHRGGGVPATSAAALTATAAVAAVSPTATSATSLVDATRAAAGLVAASTVAGVGGRRATPAAKFPAEWCEARLGEEQELQQLLRKQQQELAEQLRRLNFLEKRQHEVRLPHLQRRQDWWQRLHALETQLQRQKASLEHRQQRGFRMLQNVPKQQLMHTLGEQQQIEGSDGTRRFAFEHYEQRFQVNEQQLPADKGMFQSGQQERRGSSELHALGGFKGELRSATGDTRPFLTGAANALCPFRKTLPHAVGQGALSLERNSAAPASLLVLSQSTRKFEPSQLVYQQQQQRYQQQEERGQPQQRDQQEVVGENWPSRQKTGSAPRSRVVSWCVQSCADVGGSVQPTFTVKREQLLLDDDDEQELLELQEISEALEAADL